MKKKRLFPPSQNLCSIYGFHAVRAALENPRRACVQLFYTHKVPDPEIEKACARRRHLTVTQVSSDHLDRLLGEKTTHQGLLLQARPLIPLRLEDVLEEPGRSRKPEREEDESTGALEQSLSSASPLLVMLDQLTDPHNVGAIVRSAAAFGVRALVTQDRHAPDASNPILCKTACGGIERLPFLQVTNLARTLEELKRKGYWSIGLDERGDQSIDQIQLDGPKILVLGAEGSGMRRLVREKCDVLASIPTHRPFGTLNVSNAAAIALYELSRSLKKA